MPALVSRPSISPRAARIRSRERWQDVGQNVHIFETTLSFDNIYGQTRTATIFLRVDCRCRYGEGIRVDAAKGIPLYEAIDDGVSPATLRAAKTFALTWLAAARAQRTLSPRGAR